MSLPDLDFVISCGHCGFDVEVDSETYTCNRCGLYWYHSDGSVHFIDEDLPPCGAEYQGPVVNFHEGYDGPRYRHAPCPLPAGHETEEHWHPLEPTTERVDPNA